MNRSTRLLLLAGLGMLLPAGSLTAAVPSRSAGEIRAEDFPRLHTLLKPQPGEAKWAEIPWLTSLPEARQRAAAADKPLFVWRAGGGEVLGRA
jgi:hypothetical protein